MKIRLSFDELNEATIINLLRSGAAIVGLTHERLSFNVTFEGDETTLEALRIALNEDKGVDVADSLDEFLATWGVE